MTLGYDENEGVVSVEAVLHDLHTAYEYDGRGNVRSAQAHVAGAGL